MERSLGWSHLLPLVLIWGFSFFFSKIGVPASPRFTYSEAQVKTLKYRPEFTDSFASVEQARAFCREFFSWYNNQHRHSGIGLLTPAMVHHGTADQITARRAEVLANAYAHHPGRFKRGRPNPRTIDSNVWINRPDDTSYRSLT